MVQSLVWKTSWRSFQQVPLLKSEKSLRMTLQGWLSSEYSQAEDHNMKPEIGTSFSWITYHLGVHGFRYTQPIDECRIDYAELVIFHKTQWRHSPQLLVIAQTIWWKYKIRQTHVESAGTYGVHDQPAGCTYSHEIYTGHWHYTTNHVVFMFSDYVWMGNQAVMICNRRCINICWLCISVQEVELQRDRLRPRTWPSSAQTYYTDHRVFSIVTPSDGGHSTDHSLGSRFKLWIKDASPVHVSRETLFERSPWKLPTTI